MHTTTPPTTRALMTGQLFGSNKKKNAEKLALCAKNQYASRRTDRRKLLIFVSVSARYGNKVPLFLFGFLY